MSEIRRYGYIRVSSKDQNEARQLESMKDLGIMERDYFIDKQSGKNFDRPQYQTLKSVLRHGDILFIKELDRLGRNAKEIKREWQDITYEIGAHIVILVCLSLTLDNIKMVWKRLYLVSCLNYLATWQNVNVRR